MGLASCLTFATGARQLVVQDALETTAMSGVYLSWLTPMTNIGASPEGAEMTTFFAPPIVKILSQDVIIICRNMLRERNRKEHDSGRASHHEEGGERERERGKGIVK